MITEEYLYEIVENESPGSVKQKMANLLIEAITDWPDHSSSLDEYLIEVRNFIKSRAVTKKALEKALTELTPNKFAWEMESITSLVEAFGLSGAEEVDRIYHILMT